MDVRANMWAEHRDCQRASDPYLFDPVIVY